LGLVYCISLRESHSASDNGWSALVYDGNEVYHTKQYQVRIVDRVGSGDSFASGLIYGLVTGMPMAEAAEFGVAASALKHTIPGDLNHATLSRCKRFNERRWQWSCNINCKIKKYKYKYKYK
jgi:2-dehydro-3-deoxygluconokinase